MFTMFARSLVSEMMSYQSNFLQYIIEKVLGMTDSTFTDNITTVNLGLS